MRKKYFLLLILVLVLSLLAWIGFSKKSDESETTSLTPSESVEAPTEALRSDDAVTPMPTVPAEPSETPTNAPTPSPTLTPTPTLSPTPTLTPTPTPSPTPTLTPTPTPVPHEHEYEETVVDPTCTEKGYTLFTCTVCADSYTDNEVEATGHNIDELHRNRLRCLEEQEILGSCTECSYKYVRTEPAPGHQYGEYKYNKDATYYEDGTESAKCAVCGIIDRRTVEGTRLTEKPTPTPTEGSKEYDGYDEFGNGYVSYTHKNGLETRTFDVDCPSYPIGEIIEVNEKEMMIYFNPKAEGSPITEVNGMMITRYGHHSDWYTKTIKLVYNNLTIVHYTIRYLCGAQPGTEEWHAYWDGKTAGEYRAITERDLSWGVIHDDLTFELITLPDDYVIGSKAVITTSDGVTVQCDY
ncbi:MAG: hypothetical protein IJY09_02835 [Lachnospiraceae bacterium]|nr:hypothetical protein [Lachnospiraceae bacterium]